MKKNGLALMGALFLLSMAVAPGASASLAIPVGSGQADDLIINFDFTGSTPPPL
jgi:hypothetical protein